MKDIEHVRNKSDDYCLRFIICGTPIAVLMYHKGKDLAAMFAKIGPLLADFPKKFGDFVYPILFPEFLKIMGDRTMLMDLVCETPTAVLICHQRALKIIANKILVREDGAKEICLGPNKDSVTFSADPEPQVGRQSHVKPL
ncbi:hypothetical protein SDJN02_01843 [Cucurbita argyrosperma subsp. argyrosperma]|nr:hypothetical protein SDJN02_01843 [Cucurbita argyrosperma subsp. argyrosperma]